MSRHTPTLAGGWQTMASAPRDGTAILAILPGSNVPHSIRYAVTRSNGRAWRGWLVCWDGHRLSDGDGPDYWQPFPPHPTQPA